MFSWRKKIIVSDMSWSNFEFSAAFTKSVAVGVAASSFEKFWTRR
jgi:hypothetical protein